MAQDLERNKANAIAEGALVEVHGYQPWPGHKAHVGMNIFRLDAGGKIVEHWDVLQIIPESGKHDNGML